jgi:single-strand DNA-binding protein
MLNIVVIVGRLTGPPRTRVLPKSGDALVEYDVRVRVPGERAETVPVVWPDAPPAAAGYQPEAEVVVVGRVRRRFFRAAGATASRTEVVAEAVVPTRQGKRVQALLAGAAARVGEVRG